MITFTWDPKKNEINIKKHGVDFIEAQSAFFDENAIVISDPDHSEVEERFVLMGMSKNANLLIVCHCYRENDEIIRIISARKATKKESLNYVRG